MEASIQDIEKRSLGPAKWANLVMGAAGITAAIASNADALMLDGLFSGVNFLAAVLAARVAASVQQKPDALRPFGYEIDEPMYVMFRSLVLTGIILAAMYNAVNKIISYWDGEIIPEVKLDWVVGYVAFMAVICFSMALWHRSNWIKTGRQSDLLKTEKSAAVIDGIISGAAGAAFLAIALLRKTPLTVIVPVSDAIVVLGLAFYMIPQPIRLFTNAYQEVVGASADQETTKKLRDSIDGALADTPFTLLQAALTKVGRSFFAALYIKPEGPISVEELDDIRQKVFLAGQADLSGLRMEVIFTGVMPYK